MPAVARRRCRRLRRALVATGAAAVLGVTGLGVTGLAATALGTTTGGPPHDLAVAVRAPDGKLLARVRLPGRDFAIGYRNSVYHTRAEERYQIRPDGRFEVVQLAAEQVAVLEEYYAVPTRPRATAAGDRLDYVAPPDPARPPVFDELQIAATDLGERTLFVPGQQPLALWLLVEADPTVIVQIEEMP